MVSFGANGSFISGTAINRWDPAVTTSLAGLWTRSNALALLADDGSHVLTGDNRSEAIIYDLSLSGKGNVSGTYQRFANTFTTIDLAEGNDLLDLTVHPNRHVPAYLTPVTAIGGAGADKIWAGYGNDVIYGDTANSSLITINISLFQSGFADQIYGGDGNDTIYGDYGALDFANVSLGSFQFGDDYVNGGNGNDVIYGDYGASSFASVNVSLFSYGDDNLFGGAGNDTIYGDNSSLGAISVAAAALSFGSDTIHGGDGDDVIYGDPGAPGGALGVGLNILSFVHDEIYGDAGADYIVGDSAGSLIGALAGGSDLLSGGAGADTIVGDYTGNLSTVANTLNFGNDTISGGDDGDVLVGDYASSLGLTAASLLAFGNDSISGDAGNDTIYGDTSNNSLAGLGAGQDTINGGTGNDVLWGDYPALLATGSRDFFVFAPGSGADTIKDFHQDTPVSSLAGYNDKIDLTAYGASGIHSMSQLSITYRGGDATINLGGGDTIRVEGPDNLTAPGLLGNPLHSTDFIFG
jgi:Ca2+-binding RTX toxin-like protein